MGRFVILVVMVIMMLSLNVSAQEDTLLHFDNLILSSDFFLNENPKNNKPLQLITTYDTIFNASNSQYALHITDTCYLTLQLTAGNYATGGITIIINDVIDDSFISKKLGTVIYEFSVIKGDKIEVRADRPRGVVEERNVILEMILIR